MGGVGANGSVLRTLRVVRLVKIMRLARLMRMISELRTILSCLSGSMKSLFWNVVLLWMVVYILGVYFTQVVSDYKRSKMQEHPDAELDDNHKLLDTHFGSLSKSFLALFQSVTGGIDWDTAARPLFEVGWTAGAIFMLYILFTTLAVLNVVTGIFVDTALKSAKADKDAYMVNQVWDLFTHTDYDASGRVHWEEFKEALDTVEMQEYFKEIDVDLAEAKVIFKLLDVDNEGALKPMDFLSGCMRLRGPAKALDMRVLMQKHRNMEEKLRDHSLQVEQCLSWLCEQFASGSLCTDMGGISSMMSKGCTQQSRQSVGSSVA